MAEPPARVVDRPAFCVFADEAESVAEVLRAGLKSTPRNSPDFDVAFALLAGLVRFASACRSKPGSFDADCGNAVDGARRALDGGSHALISTADAAVRLGVTTSRVRQMLRDETLAGQKLAGSWCVDAASLATRCR